MTPPAATSAPSALPHPRDARHAKGLSIRQLADVSDTSPSTVLRCEQTGQYPQRHRARRRYLAALGLTEPTSSPAGA